MGLHGGCLPAAASSRQLNPESDEWGARVEAGSAEGFEAGLRRGERGVLHGKVDPWPGVGGPP